MVPLNIGYAQVAGLPPTVGLYTSIAPMIAFAVFASSRQLIAGPDAPIAALIGSLLASLAATSDPRYVQLAYAQGLVLFALQEHGVTVLGTVPSGLPSLTVPDVVLSDYLDLVPGALAICGVTLADSVLVGRKYAQQHRETFDADQQMLALGAANVAGAMTGGFVTGSSASRTAAMATTGARTQLPSIVGAVIVAVVLIAFTDLLALLPNAVLAAIILDAILSLIEVGELRELFRVRRSEFMIALACIVTVLTVGSLAAVVVAFLLSTIDIVRRAADPSISQLRQSPDRTGFFVTSAAEGAPSIPGLLILRFGGPLFFGNAETFHQRIAERAKGASPDLAWLVLDMEAALTSTRPAPAHCANSSMSSASSTLNSRSHARTLRYPHCFAGTASSRRSVSSGCSPPTVTPPKRTSAPADCTRPRRWRASADTAAAVLVSTS